MGMSMPSMAFPSDFSDHRDEGRSSTIYLPLLYALKRVTRPNHRTPHMGNRGIVKPETFLRLLEVPANHVFEIVDVDRCVRIEGIWIVHGDKPARHVPFVPTRLLVGLANVVWRLIVVAEVADISLGI